ncbi:MAG: GntG family PLP-dependent aldolase, partial [Chloroflexota bacterium]
AGLFVSSGTQGNLVSLLSHGNRGDEVICGIDSHIFNWEAGGMSVLGGMYPKPLPTDEIGRLNPADVEAAVRPDNPHMAISRIVCAENSSGGNFGAAIPPGYFADIRTVADQHGLKFHLDGARLFNATTSLGIDVKEVTQYVDSASLCLSKGLCAPVGSVVVGEAEFIHKARRMRKLVGGAMRQAGVVAAAGIIALEEMTKRLDVDHKHARMLANGLAENRYITIDPDRVETNMVFFNVTPDAPNGGHDLASRLKSEHKILCNGYPQKGFRAVTHYWITEESVNTFIDAVNLILK